LIEPALEHAKANWGRDEAPALEKELQPFAATPIGVGLDVPDWLNRLENELQRVRTSHSDLSHLAESVFHVPKGQVEYAALVDQLHDWEKLSRDDQD
jgi:hypothetical protein